MSVCIKKASCTLFQYEMIEPTINMSLGVIPKVPWLTRTTLRPFRLFMLSSASAVVLPYPRSRWKVIHLLCLSLSFIYWAQKYTVTIHLNENHLVVIITLHRKPLQLLIYSYSGDYNSGYNGGYDYSYGLSFSTNDLTKYWKKNFKEYKEL